MILKYILYLGLFLFFGCGTKSDKTVDEIMGVQSILWTQYSAEVEALFLQGYNIASKILVEYDFHAKESPLAVTLDLDETVLDNSPFSVEMIRQGFDYSEEKWAEWCERREARRELVWEHHEIVLLVGDNLGDFDGIYDDRSDSYGKNEVRENALAFGSRYILMPNPMYGSWERGVFPEGMPSESEILEKLRGYE
jgi:predicted secreted acid phosphatase